MVISYLYQLKTHLIAVKLNRRHHRQGSPEALVTDGIYKYIRHPQYAGLFLIIFGWLIHWPTLLTLIIFPILSGIYYWLAIQEEKELEDAFGTEYEKYKTLTPRFVPRLITKNRHKTAS
ncbi:MAG: methyltransferase family protein [Candidatus Thorarchaeota archaeon]